MSENPMTVAVRVNFTVTDGDIDKPEMMESVVMSFARQIAEALADLIDNRATHPAATSGFALPDDNTPFGIDVRVKLQD